MKTFERSEFINKLNGGALYEKEVLNIILSNAYGGRDMSVVAENLLARFPGIGAIVNASVDEITAVDGVSESVALYLKAVGAAMNSGTETQLKEIKDGEHFLSMLSRRFNCRDNEFAEFYLVNARGAVVYSKTYTSDSTDTVEMRTDEILALLTKLKPYGMYVGHNHVNCPCKPSLADDELTRKLSVLCEMCGVKFLDHGIVDSHGETFSYARLGKL